MIRAHLAAAMLIAACAACGQKGPLRLPETKKPAGTEGTAPAAPPAPATPVIPPPSGR
jgi:predicted small lipoprotein YifL